MYRRPSSVNFQKPRFRTSRETVALESIVRPTYSVLVDALALARKQRRAIRVGQLHLIGERLVRVARLDAVRMLREQVEQRRDERIR